MNRIYISGSVGQRDRIAKHMARVRDIGYEVVRDWVANSDPLPPGDDPAADVAYGSRIASDIRSADVFWIIGNKHVRGALAEMGFAVGAGIRDVLVSGAVSKPLGICHSVKRFSRPLEVDRWLYRRLHQGTELPQKMIDMWTTREESLAKP